MKLSGPVDAGDAIDGERSVIAVIERESSGYV